MARDYAIELTADERALLDQIKLSVLAKSNHIEVQKCGARVFALMTLLHARNDAIPSQRIRWFTDPACRIGGRGSSRYDQFERNGTRGDDIFRHPHFLPYLLYFICGPNLPTAVMSAFDAQVTKCSPITSGDILPLANFARLQTRGFGLDPRNASEEFFKLALEHDLSPQSATVIRNQVRAIR